MMKNLGRIYRIMSRHWGYLVAGILFMIGFALFSGISITMGIPFFDYIFSRDSDIILFKDLSSFSSALKQEMNKYLVGKDLFAMLDQANLRLLLEEMKKILLATDRLFLLSFISAVLIILIILKNCFFYGNKVFFAYLKGKSIKDIRYGIFKQYLYQPMYFFDRNRVGDSLVRMVNDVNIVANLYIESLFNVIRDVFLLLVYARIAYYLNRRLFLISLLLLPVFGMIISFVGKKIKKYARRIQEQSSSLFSNVEETLHNIKVVKAFTMEKSETERFARINNRFYQFWRKSILYASLNTPLSEINGTLTGVIVLMIGGRSVLAPGSTFSFGEFITFILAIFSMLHPLKLITNAYGGLKKASVSLDRISEILELPMEKGWNSSKRLPIKEFKASIEFHEVTFGYNKVDPVLRNITFTVRKGEKVAIVGSSGSGKTTLLALLAAFYPVEQGKILIDGRSLEEFELMSLRNLFGIVTQESMLFNATIAENISYGTSAATADQIFKAARIAYADEFIKDLPEGYETLVQPQATNLSGGQKQRLCIARAIISDPPILIFDEATSSLDSEAEKKVQKAIERVTKDRTVFLIAHRLSSILACDQIIVLDQGKIAGMGQHHELLKTCKRYEQLYKLQFEQDIARVS